ncbi:3-dehydroquinate synthase [Coccomyxa sp. Obi]|nr:3-dehydroquinate synthase [Coccomyxa sp. Obi]
MPPRRLRTNAQPASNVSLLRSAQNLRKTCIPVPLAATIAATTPQGPASKAVKKDKILWVQTSEKSVLTAALEAGVTTFLFDDPSDTLAHDWSQLAKFTAIAVDGNTIRDQPSNKKIGQYRSISSGEELKALQAESITGGITILDMADWRIIPAENLVAAFQGTGSELMPVATSAADAKVMLEALEAGTDGVVLKTNNAAEVRDLIAWLQERKAGQVERLAYEVGTVTRLEPVGMGDRVCVDLASLLLPGEGLLVGSFARALFLVHSECSESVYINSRPFRVNAGPVHAYAAAPGGRTAYLAELKSGSEVVVADAQGRQRTAIVGRIKVERRPLVLVEAETADGQAHSLLLQNAETVRLVGPSESQPPLRESRPMTVESSAAAEDGMGIRWQAISVSELHVGQLVYIRRQGAARHTGISIDEFIRER